MLKNIMIFSDNIVYLNKDYAISFKNPDFLPKFLHDIDEEMTVRGFYEKENVIDVLTIKIVCYKIKKPINIFFALTFDDSIEPEKSYPYLQELIEITLDYIEKNYSKDEIYNIKILEQNCDTIIKELFLLRPPKISVIGDENVGKTTICNLIKGSSLSDKSEPLTEKHYNSELFKIPILLYDVSISYDWKSSSKYLVGSDAIILVLDSTQKNARKSKSFIELLDEIAPSAELLIVANMQDRENALKHGELEEILKHKVFPFVAKPENQKLIQVQVAKLLELKGEGINYTGEDYTIQRND